jgi:hypothetical protein
VHVTLLTTVLSRMYTVEGPPTTPLLGATATSRGLENVAEAKGPAPLVMAEALPAQVVTMGGEVVVVMARMR